MLIFILNFRSLRYDLNQAITFFEKPRYFIFFIKIWWSMVSNAFCKSIKIIPVKRPFSNPVVILSVRCPRQVLVKYFFWKPDWNLYRILFLLKTFCVWSWIIFSIIFDKIGSSKMGWLFWGSVLEPFLKSSLTLEFYNF